MTLSQKIHLFCCRDYENVRIPRWCRTADAANAIRSAVINYGRISERRLYFDSKKVSEQFTDRVNLVRATFGPHFAYMFRQSASIKNILNEVVKSISQ